MLAILVVSALAARLAAGPETAAPAVQDPTCKGEGESDDYRVIDLQRAKTRLVVFGSRHTTDPADPMLGDIEKRVIALSPTVVLVEGEPGRDKSGNRDDVVRRGGESEFVCWLAGKRGVPCHHADLAEAEEAKLLQKKFPSDAVLVYFVVRGLAYFNPRPADQRPPGDLVEWLLRRYAPLVGWPQATRAKLAVAWQQVLHRPFDPDAVTTDWHHPFKNDLLTQRVSAEDNALRDSFMIEQLLDAAKPGARVFAIFGEGHICNMRHRLSDAGKEVGATQR